MALLLARERDQVGIAEALADRGGRGRGGARGVGVAGGDVAQQRRDQQVAPLDAVLPRALERALRRARTIRPPAGLAAQQEAQADPERAAHRGQRRAGLLVEPVRALEVAPVLVLAAEHVGGGGARLEVARPERGDGGQRVVALQPRSARAGVATTLELAHARRC